MSYKPNTYIDDVAFKQGLAAYNEKIKGKYATIASLSDLNTTVDALQTVLGGGEGIKVSVASDADIRSLFQQSI